MGSAIHTADPLALRYLMTETLFDVRDDAVVGGPSVPRAAPAPAPVERPTVPEAAIAAPQAPSFRYFGGNRQRYLFLTDDREYEWMSAAALDAFTKTLTALKLATDDVSVFNVAGMQPFPSKDDVFSYFGPRVVVSLGVSLPWPGLEGPATGSVVDHQGVRVFHTHAFETFLTDADKKRLFWTTIKTLLT